MTRLRNLNFVFLLLPVITLFSSCGLHDYPYLEPPHIEETFKGSPGSAVINNRSVYDPDVFNGYEIYYKYYDKGQFLSQDLSDYNTILNKNNPEPPDLTALGFRRVNSVKYLEDRKPFPMIFIDYADRNDLFDITVSMTNSEDDLKVGFSLPGYNDITLYRTVKAPDLDNNKEYYKSFNQSDISSSDADIPVSEVTLSLFVFAYGKYDLVYNIYSRPVRLGHINF